MKKHERIIFLEGMIEGISMYAIWKNDEQLVGCMQKPLKIVIAPYLQEIEKLKEDIRSSGQS